MLDHTKKIKILNRVYTRLNYSLFGGELLPVRIDIQNVSTLENELYGVYRHDPTFGNSILLSYEFEDDIEKLTTQKKQVYFIVLVMLHEMIHQICDQHGLDDSNHSEAWQEQALSHGLYSLYEDGEMIEEYLLPLSIKIADTIRIR